jgi:glycosyltransferase involved in cell wall biosynthesis
MNGLKAQGVVTLDGGGGGNFFRTALFKWQADILHFHWLHPYLLRRGRLASMIRATRFLAEVALLRLSGARIVWTVHNLVNHDQHLPGVERFFTRRFARMTNGIIVHSQDSLQAAQAAFQFAGGTLKAAIPQGSYAGHYPNEMTRAECRAKLQVDEDALVFLFLGRIEPYKGVTELIDCFKKIPGNVQLLIAGRVSGVGSLEQLRSAIDGAQNIRLFDRFIPDNELQIYFNAADVYVYPVRGILNSGSISLAMSFGLPCIAPRLGGISEMLGEDGGILFDPEQPNGLLDALKEAPQRRVELASIGRRNLARAREWTWEMVARRTRELYDECLVA